MSKQLRLVDSKEKPLNIDMSGLSLTSRNDSSNMFFVTFKVTFDLYQHIENESLFNLRPEILTLLGRQEFNTSENIHIKAVLDAELWSKLLEKAQNTEQVVTYLTNLEKNEPNHPSLSAHSWYALEVKQEQRTCEVGYRTLWYYLNPADITPNGIDPQKMNQAMLNFAEEWKRVNGQSTDASTSSDSQPSPEDLISQSIQELTQTFENLSQELTSSTEELVSETVQEMTQTFTELSTSFSEMAQEIEELVPETSIYNTIIDFFKVDSWPIRPLPNQSVVQFAFQGKNGKLDGYAKARQDQEQAIVYSVYPRPVSKEQRFAIAEFITRANYGMLLGNFELDYTDGEIRYKTSIDVEGDTLTHALIQNLVYTNVMTMDQYLPGLLAILENGTSPEQAIRLVEEIEQSEAIPAAS